MLASIPALAAALAYVTRRRAGWLTPARYTLGTILLAVEVWWFIAFILAHSNLARALPLQLSDATILLATYIAFTLNKWLFDVVYYWALTAMPLAMLTPDVREAFSSPYTILFFILHGLAVLIVLYLLWSRTLQPRPGSVWRSFIALNVFTVIVYGMNQLLDTNYMYLMHKPAQPSPLDYFGPWPWYIFVSYGLALAAFFLLWLPYRTKR